MTSKNHHLLFSKSAPAGIISLELTRNNSTQYQVFTEWNRPGNYVYVRDWSSPSVKSYEHPIEEKNFYEVVAPAVAFIKRLVAIRSKLTL
ncbi:hypothetical protein [Pedobacter gandavensis]|uniref:KTSC domain-containing protein n=1 Tax=Pedobacter gandavensis TaxID=2679963 RepID=A0ABR6ESH0_9SPHI|nr:hypothetical protein [Pedobacter gandavensis]MBB2148209.1 hypothetical protein [Pedobacter gandavensis]